MQKSKNLYVWLNPVIERVVGEDYPALIEVIQQEGYRVVTTSNQGDRIKTSYKEYIETVPNKPVIDGRCPAIIELVKEQFPQVLEKLAPIPPILIACAQELYEEHIKGRSDESSLTIVTPCTQLVYHGEDIFKGKIRFVTWKEFQEEVGFAGTYSRPKSSPIPLGFFDTLDVKVLKMSGEDKVRQSIQQVYSKDLPSEIELLELLFCEEGCHNGDGI